MQLALARSLFAVCAVAEGRDAEVVGCGRVIGDGGLHVYLTDIVVVPAHQRRGIGSRIVAALTGWVERLPYANTLAAVLPTPGLRRFYERHGYVAQGPEAPAMSRWINERRA